MIVACSPVIRHTEQYGAHSDIHEIKRDRSSRPGAGIASAPCARRPRRGEIPPSKVLVEERDDVAEITSEA